jgi:nucleotide-binding universal stress UspA family protein
MYETIVWATDGRDAADVAFEEALSLAGWMSARLLAVHVNQHIVGRGGPSVPLQVDEPDIRTKVAAQVERAHEAGVDAELVVRSTQGEPARIVATVALDAQADVIVCGTRGLDPLSSAVLGSFTQRLLHLAPCPVLAVGPRSEAHEVVPGRASGAAG